MAMRPAGQSTLEDVARAAGVSRSTASRVISGYGSASQATRDRVHFAASRLGYRPDQAARSLAGRSGFRLVVAVLGTTARVLDDPYVDRAVAAAAEAGARYDVGVSLQWLPRQAPRLVEDRSVRGVRRTVLRRWPDTDAVFAVNDATALGALAALRADGRRVPDDVAVGGFDDIPFAALSMPALTTASHPVGPIVAAAVTAVLDESPVPPATVFPSTLIRRESA